MNSYLAGPVIPPKPQVIRGVDLDAQGLINGQSTYEHDLNSYKEDEKPWKKPGLIEILCYLKLYFCFFVRSGY
jgi:hypothetical protein